MLTSKPFVLAAAFALLSAGVSAQEAYSPVVPPATDWVKKTPEGQPNLEGIWRAPPIAIYSYDIQDPIPENAFPGRSAAIFKKTFKPIIVDPPDGRIPYQPWAAERRAQLYELAFNPTNLQEIDPQALCVPHGPPRTATQLFLQIFQFPGYVVISNETAQIYRVIPLDGRPHIPDQIKLFGGDSRGHWEGDTLVVDVTNNNGRNWLSVMGDFHSDQFKVQERLTRLASNSLMYEATMTDPVVYTRPWTVKVPLIPPGAPYEFLESACHEGNGSFGFTKFRDQAAAKMKLGSE